MAKKKAAKAEVAPSFKYTVTLRIDKDVYTFSADTVLDALNQLPVMPVTYKGILTTTNGNKTHEKLFQTFELRRLLSNPITRVVMAKFITLALL